MSLRLSVGAIVIDVALEIVYVYILCNCVPSVLSSLFPLRMKVVCLLLCLAVAQVRGAAITLEVGSLSC